MNSPHAVVESARARPLGRLCCIVVMATAAGCARPSVEEVSTTAAVPVVVEVAKVDLLQAFVTATGLVGLAPGAEMVIIAPETARIAEIPKAEGDVVRKGDVLVRFDIPTLAADVAARRASVSQATARVDAAKANFTRLSALLAQGVAAPREVEDAKRQQAEAEADVEQAKSGVEAALAMSGRAVVVAPFSGVVAKRFHNVGDLVEATASDPVLRLIDPTQLQVVAAIPVSELSRIAVGRVAHLRRAVEDDGEDGKVLTKAVQVDPGSATADVRIAFSKATTLTAGMTVRVEIVAEERPKALVIPAAALVDDEGDLFVMVAGDDNKAHRFPVAIGLSTRTLVEVTSGLKAGDRVIVRGQDGLPEGAVIIVESK